MTQAPVDYMRLMTHMTDVLAHDIRNPLNNILLSTAQFKMGALPDKEDTAFYIDIIERNCDRVSQLLTDIAGVMQPRAVTPATVNIVALAEELQAENKERMTLKNISWQHSPGEGAMEGVFDREQVKTALQQLIDNALDAGKKDGELKLEAQITEQFCLLTVADQGGGIPADVLPGIYMPFFTTRDRHKGLGLTLAKNIAEAHHGRIEVATDALGSRFTLVLPR